ncbi:PAS domain S-box protein [Mucilaginibacter lacusdianchii]|uniref:PAS domain S-box protein n=1 Tax=Mucilaginibacter lacusdianchii TaxID=2684211 RepID=UPI00131D898C|nr:PAS domain S-box protein [Mucilaginibacter sp. JXJ CY 39]
MPYSYEQSLVDALPVGAAIISGPEHTVKAVNAAMLSIWHTTGAVVGKNFHDVLSEVQHQDFSVLISDIYRTGQPFHGPKAITTMLLREGILQPVHFDYWLNPFKSAEDDIIGVLITAIDNTEKIIQEKRAQEAAESVQAVNEILKASEEQLQLAIESAELGTWFLDTETRALRTSPRSKELFGYYPEEEMSLDDALAQVTDEYRLKVLEAINRTIAYGESYRIQYPVIGFHDGKLRWVSATGMRFAARKGETPIFSGTLADITEQKRNEQRKNDFISMVSHELKTPLTSTISYVQISQKKLAACGDPITASMLERAGKQLGKMTTLINGFLNVSRLEAGQIHIDKRPFDLAGLVKDVEEGLIAEAGSHQIIFAPVEETWVHADKDKIEQVVNNFISNAIKDSPHSTTI